MTRLRWDDIRQRTWESGVDRGVLYPPGAPGVPWNGLISVNEATDQAEVVEMYYDGQKFRQYGLPGEFVATLEAYTYPPEFEPYDGFDNGLTQQRRQSFGLSYRTMVNERAYKIHLVYNALTAPSGLDHESISEDIDPGSYIWGISTTPIPITGVKASAHLVIDSRIAYPSVVSAFEDLLYGSDAAIATLPSPVEVLEFFESRTILRIVDHGDGTWTATGPDEAIQMLDSTTFEITWPSAVYIGPETYRISSM